MGPVTDNIYTLILEEPRDFLQGLYGRNSTVGILSLN